MKGIYRVVDANANRAAEGIRVLEDAARFLFDDEQLVYDLRTIRHGIRNEVTGILDKCLDSRNSSGDVGLNVSLEKGMDRRNGLSQLIAANFKRVQEALRNLEENLKLINMYDASKRLESLRFETYTLEKRFYEKKSTKGKLEKLNTDLYCITSEQHSLGRNNIEVVKNMLEAGVKIIQYREKKISIRQKYTECIEIRKLTCHAGAAFIVNGHADIAIIVNADGVHLEQNDIPVPEVRKLLGSEMIIGISTHSPEQALIAVKQGADYITVGPIYKSFTKENAFEPAGLDYLDYVVENIDLPFVATGGINEHNIMEIAAHGARCVAPVTEITGSKDIKGKILSLRKKMHSVL